MDKPTIEKVVIYYRVSTGKQDNDNQKPAVKNFLKTIGKYEILASYEEKESGKTANRPQLQAALKLCKEHDALLIVAKLDRLSRNVGFTVSLQESQVRFKCCDMPEADDFTIHIFAALAQRERKLISERTKAGLATRKQRGKKLGAANKAIKKALEKKGYANSLKTRQRNNLEFYESLRERLTILRIKEKKSHQTISETFNLYEVKALKGGRWTKQQVATTLKALGIG